MTKFYKIYFWVTIFFFILALSFGVYVWYTVQRIETETSGIKAPSDGKTNTMVTPGETASKSSSPETIESPGNGNIQINAADLTESQREILSTFGYDDPTFTVTDAMIRCAKEAVGEKRFEEILGGSAPTPLESLKLVPCTTK